MTNNFDWWHRDYPHREYNCGACLAMMAGLDEMWRARPWWRRLLGLSPKGWD